jgi:predicted amidohydrolase
MPETEELHIALIQTDLEWENPEANINNFNNIFSSLKGNADIVILPEMFTTGFTMNTNDFSEGMNGKSVKWMIEKASETKSAICGSLIIKEGNHTYNRFVFVKPNGELTFYNKRHLFSIGNEDKYYTAGSNKVIVSYKGWRIAPFICYDLRFPVWCRNKNDSDLMIFVANWPSARKEVWTTLLKARAIENQSYVIGVNRVGEDRMNINYTGNSGTIDPKGNFIDSSDFENETIIYNTISKNDLEEFREKFPVSKDADDFTITL